MMIFYATRDGQSRRIAARICERLAGQGIDIAPRDVADATPDSPDVTRASVVALIAAVRYGRHLPEARRFLARHHALVSAPPLALASVNLTARKPARSTADSNPYLRKLIVRTRCTPVLAAAFAGRLDYPRYRWLDRQIIRFLMWLTGGPTDPAASIEYTSWESVDAFAARLAALHAQAAARNCDAAI